MGKEEREKERARASHKMFANCVEGKAIGAVNEGTVKRVMQPPL